MATGSVHEVEEVDAPFLSELPKPVQPALPDYVKSWPKEFQVLFKKVVQAQEMASSSKSKTELQSSFMRLKSMRDLLLWTGEVPGWIDQMEELKKLSKLDADLVALERCLQRTQKETDDSFLAVRLLASLCAL
jgi:hypothetical protein